MAEQKHTRMGPFFVVKIISQDPWLSIKDEVSGTHFRLTPILIDLEGALTKEPVWFEYEEVEPISTQECDYLISA